VAQTIYVLLAIGAGAASALQTALIASLSRTRGPMEATWISLFATVTALSLIFFFRTVRGDAPALSSPLTSPVFYLVLGSVAGVTLAIALRGSPFYLAGAGLLGLTFLFGMAFLTPRIGIALMASAATAGTLMASVILDHYGAFGGQVHHVSFVRVAGLAVLMLGVVLVRSSR
jgi:transporter family-2 protein